MALPTLDIAVGGGSASGLARRLPVQTTMNGFAAARLNMVIT